MDVKTFKKNEGFDAVQKVAGAVLARPVAQPRAAPGMRVGVSEQIDYEAELAVVIGNGGRDISRAEGGRHWHYRKPLLTDT